MRKNFYLMTSDFLQFAIFIPMQIYVHFRFKHIFAENLWLFLNVATIIVKINPMPFGAESELIVRQPGYILHFPL